jgi:acetyl esterase/lipase
MSSALPVARSIGGAERVTKLIGWVAGSRSGYAFAGAGYAGQGFITVVPDYRLVPTVRFPAFIEDGALAVKWTRDHIAALGGDPDRIAVAGHSAGSYNAAI